VANLELIKRSENKLTRGRGSYEKTMKQRVMKKGTKMMGLKEGRK
jgi:hypothetical protein